MRISDWSSDVCSSDLGRLRRRGPRGVRRSRPPGRTRQRWRPGRRAPWWPPRRAPLTTSAPDLRDPGVEQTELSNGLRIVTETLPGASSVSLGAWVRVGGRDEYAELAGAEHFLEQIGRTTGRERGSPDG